MTREFLDKRVKLTAKQGISIITTTTPLRTNHCIATLNQLKSTSGAPLALHVIVAVLPLSAAAFRYTGDLSTSGETNNDTIIAINAALYNTLRNQSVAQVSC